MALSEHVINFNYNQAIAKAEELESAASKLESDAIAEIDEIIGSINRNWEGENATSYIQKCTAEQQNLSSIATSMRNTASTIRTMAKNIYDAEMRALAIARAAEEAARKAAAEAAARAATTIK